MIQISCTTCDKRFDLCHPDSHDQAYGCAVEVREDGKRLLATGHYGSQRFDGDEIDLTESKAKPKVGIVCDDCIQTALDQGGKIAGSCL